MRDLIIKEDGLKQQEPDLIRLSQSKFYYYKKTNTFHLGVYDYDSYFVTFGGIINPCNTIELLLEDQGNLYIVKLAMEVVYSRALARCEIADIFKVIEK